MGSSGRNGSLRWGSLRGHGGTLASLKMLWQPGHLGPQGIDHRLGISWRRTSLGAAVVEAAPHAATPFEAAAVGLVNAWRRAALKAGASCSTSS